MSDYLEKIGDAIATSMAKFYFTPGESGITTFLILSASSLLSFFYLDKISNNFIKVYIWHSMNKMDKHLDKMEKHLNEMATLVNEINASYAYCQVI